MSDDVKTEKEDSKPKEGKKFPLKVEIRPEPIKMAKPEKLYSFEQWAARRGVPTHHHGGMRAFVKNPNKHRTLEQWDVCLVGY